MLLRLLRLLPLLRLPVRLLPLALLLLRALLLPTRQEPGNLDYALFQLRDAPDTFYMRESWRNQEALDAHITLPHFQDFIAQMDSLLAGPLRLDYLTPVAP